MLLKLDLSKAFDKISWEYLRTTLLAFGFDPTWVSWIVNLTSSALFSILINGVPSSPFSPTRGIRQGDPLSPFLFIILAEGLNRTLKVAISDCSLSGLTLHGISPPISHSQFIYDSLLMGVPTVREALRIKSIINLFCEASGMDVNLSKSQIFFFNTPVEIQHHLTLLLGFTCNTLPSTYLGIPLIDNPLKNLSWDSLLSKFRKKLSLWTFPLPQSAWTPHPSQVCPTSYASLCLLCSSSSEFHPHHFKKYPKALSMARHQGRMQNNPRKLAKSLQTKERRGIGPQRPDHS
jgi:hypothetical protein